MKIINFLIALICICPSFCWGQGQIKNQQKEKKILPTPSKKTVPDKDEVKIYPTENKPKEIINDITVNWGPEVTEQQKNILKNLINNLILVRRKEGDKYSDFRIDKYEVTQDLFLSIMNYNPSYFIGNNLPVEQVSWNECQDFINEINRLTNLNFRLPTLEEWEYAASGGIEGKGSEYSKVNNNIDELCWFSNNSKETTHPVGTKLPNDLGIYDMLGNVGEWTSDTHPYSYSNRINYIFHVSSWNTIKDGVKISNSYYFENSFRMNDLGFRIVLDEDRNK